MTRLAVVCDLLEENWPSMDLVAEMLLRHLRADHPGIQANRICPPLVRRLSRLPVLGSRRMAFNADRLLNRFHDYPRHLRRRIDDFDFFHVCDHSYANLVHVLPAERTGVFCHDLDTFRCLLEPARARRPGWFRAMARRILRGLQKAVLIFYSTNEVRREIEHHGLIESSRLVQAPYGVSPVFTTEPAEPDLPAGMLNQLSGAPFLLHVGSCIPRKRIDVLLDVFAGVRARHAGLHLVQVGGEWTGEQRRQIERLGIGPAVIQLPRQDQAVIAALYRRAALVLMPSEAEGFGLPVIEALACGAVLVASDIPVLREVGGAAGVYCPLADVPAWVRTIDRLLSSPVTAPSLSTRLAQVRCYSWSKHAETILNAYRRLNSGIAATDGSTGVVAETRGFHVPCHSPKAEVVP